MNRTLERLKEIFVWNTYLTKIYDKKYFENAEEFLNEVIQVYGPYIEKILPPMLWEENWDTVSQKYGIHPIVREAVAEIIFNGDSQKKPYFHQGYAVKTLAISNSERKDTIITAPTATGKTECFLIPILDYCVKAKISDRENNLKAIIIYPMKTLEADQLNRIIKYLNQINIRLKNLGAPFITVGIWDGDTPNSPVGETEEDVGVGAKIVDGQSVRGLECPTHKNKLIWNRRSLVCEEGCSFPWIFVTRKDMRENSVDLLITNPEALEFALLSPHNKGFLIVSPERSKVKYIVFDETHVWSGASASSLSLLIQRLRHLYKSSRPTFILSSATITNPKEYASRLLLLREDEINHVDFKGRIRQLEASNLAKYEINPCKFNVILGTLFAAENYSKSVDTILELLEANDIGSDNTERLNALKTCEKLSLIQITSNCVELTDEGKKFFEVIKKCSIDDFSDAKASELLDSSEFLERWASLIENKVPEVFDLLSVFGDCSFIHEQTLINHVKEKIGNDSGKAAEIVATLLNWGRAGNFLLDKYHYFIKPIEHVYWCPSDKVLFHKKICPKCGKETVELRFCRKCHEPYILSNEKLKPIRKDLFNEAEPKFCQCGRRLDAEIMGIGSTSYQTFITFLLSALGRNAYHRKVLVFSDSRGEAEAITTFTRSLDYSLVLHIEACKILLENSPKDGMQAKRLHDKLKDKAVEIYFKGTPFDIEDEDLKPMRSQYFQFLYNALSTIYGPKSNKSRHNRLFSSSIISFKNIQDIFSVPLEVSIAHYMLVEVGYEELIPIESIQKKLRRYFYHLYKLDKKNYQSVVQEVLNKLVESGLLEKVKNNVGKDCIKLPDAWEYKFIFFVPSYLSYCENCYIGYPTILDECPNCGSKQFLNRGSRFIITEKAEEFDYTGGCFENIRKEVPYKLDHWANEILYQAIKNIRKKADAIFIADHRSGLPAIMRSRLEEGFRVLSPTVNVICCTPTMELGIDIGSLNCACMIGIPPTKTNYIQRTGRTGRTISLPSILITIIRNEHAVDNHYLNKIEEYLNRKSELLKIPQFTETIIKQHLVSMTLHFLNRVSPKYENDYYDIFPAQNRFQFAGKKNIIFLQKILSRKLLMFFEDVLDNYDGIVNFILENLKEAALFAMEEKFSIKESQIRAMIQELFLGYNGNPPEVVSSILNVVKSYVEVYKLMEDNGIDTGELLQNFLDNFSCLSLCLSQPRLIADYRGIMRSIPVAFAGKRFNNVTIELKELGHAIREAFPGFIKADGTMARGALMRQQGIEYEIIDVKTIDRTVSVVKMCPNKKCSLAFHPFDISTKMCPLCKSELTEIRIFPIFGAVAKSKGRQNIVNTTPIVSTLVPLYKEELKI
jgi:ribosomal protein L40E